MNIFLQKPAHRLLAETAAEVLVATEDAHAQMREQGLTPPTESQTLAERLRQTLAAYDVGAMAAAGAPINLIIDTVEQAIHQRNATVALTALDTLRMTLGFLEPASPPPAEKLHIHEPNPEDPGLRSS